MTSIVRSIAVLLCAVLFGASAVPAAAQSGTAAIVGRVVDHRSALPVAGATVTATRGGTAAGSASTDGSGRYTIAGLVPGIYTVTVRAGGYDSSQTGDIALPSGATTTLDASLSLAVTSNRTTLDEIGRTSTTHNPLVAATTISQSLSLPDLTNTGQIRVGDQLATLPAVNFQSSSSVGDDASIDLRGLGTDESAALLDGHPVGPLGVGSGGFNFALGPAYGLSRIDVTYGSGAQGLYGSDTIGGAVNFLTIGPTAKPQFSFQQQLGGYGISSTGITATGTYKRLGYAAAAAVLGTYGDFAPFQNSQSARPDNVQAGSVNPNGACVQNGNDVSPCNLAANTYDFSGNTEQKLSLVKLSYALGTATTVTATAYDAVQWSDSTANGDNDYLPYAVRLNQVVKGGSNCTTAGGTPGYTVTTDPLAGTTTCYTAQQYAAATYGPDGGGAGRQRSTRMGDYHLSLTTQAGPNNIRIDGYINNYVFQKDSSLAGGIDASGNDLGTPTYADFYNTKGILISDEITGRRNDLAFGYDVWHQLQTGDERDASGITVNPPAFFGEWSGFVRDDYQLGDQVTFFANAWLKHSSVTTRTTFDPRATLQFRPSRNDVLQVTYGRSDGAPSPSLKLVGVPVASDPGSSLTSVNCGGFNDVTSAGNPNLQSEAANDFEIGYGHRFKADSNVQVNAYVTDVTNQLFGASEPLTAFGAANVNFAPGALTTYITRLNSQCGLNLNNQTVLQYLSVSTTYNAAHALARGIELSGRQRINRIAYLDYLYTIESSAHEAIDENILQNNPLTINGAQLAGIPLHQATVSLDVAPGPYELRIDNYYTEFNNGYNRPSYWHSNAFLSRSFGGGKTLLTLGGTNIFNNAAQVYGYLGLGVPSGVNAISTLSPRTPELFGLAPARLTLTLQQKF